MLEVSEMAMFIKIVKSNPPRDLAILVMKTYYYCLIPVVILTFGSLCFTNDTNKNFIGLFCASIFALYLLGFVLVIAFCIILELCNTYLPDRFCWWRDPYTGIAERQSLLGG